jgi:tRNA pseudouridine38-40 synthase
MSNRITHALKVEYDGTNYSGWQRQPNSNSVQQEIEHALKKLTGHEIQVLGSGRTDAGVHARGQIAHFKTPIEIFSIPEEKIIRAINSRLPKDIRILGHCIPHGDFHCTRDAIYREYSYSVTKTEHVFNRYFTTYYPYPLDEEKLLSSGKFFLGEYDFTSFSKINLSTISYVCNVSVCEWECSQYGEYILHIGANRFVYAMVRSIVGAMLEYARGTISENEIVHLLEVPQRNSQLKRTPVAEPQGLVLEKVIYPEHFGIQL